MISIYWRNTSYNLHAIFFKIKTTFVIYSGVVTFCQGEIYILQSFKTGKLTKFLWV